MHGIKLKVNKMFLLHLLYEFPFTPYSMDGKLRSLIFVQAYVNTTEGQLSQIQNSKL